MREKLLTAGVFVLLIGLFAFAANDWRAPWAGKPVHGADWCCTQLARSTLASSDSATTPSTPAVFRPALTSVTRRTLTNVFARDRSISFCRLRTFFRSPSRDAVKIL